MSKAKLLVTAALIGLAGLVVPGVALYNWASTSTGSGMSDYPASKVWTYNCEYEDQKPTELLEYCADGNGGIANIEWSSWSSEGAEGTGVYFRNNCEPDCTSGKFSYTDVVVYLDGQVKAKGRVHLTALSYQEIDKTGQVVDGGISGGWDVSEMYRMMRA